MDNRPLPRFLTMQNPIQHYAWGSTSALKTLFGIPNPEHQPQAEIWMGAHPKASSCVTVGGRTISLNEFIAQNPQTILGEQTAKEFGELPYLFKVLCAAKALSVQVHPSKEQAEKGFQREQQSGIPLNSAQRNYKDPNHKPELVYALTPYQAMNGFRSIDEIVTLFNECQLSEIKPAIAALENDPTPQSLATFFKAVLSLEGEVRSHTLSQLHLHSQKHLDEPHYALIDELFKQYPDDIGVLAPLMLNVVLLQPGEAMFLYAGTPHAYVKGTGLEIMANSDNVLRAGLTPKHIDIDELQANTRFETHPIDAIRLAGQPIKDGYDYPTPVDDFCFSHFSKPSVTIKTRGAEIIFAIDQDITLQYKGAEQLIIHRGESAFIPATTDEYRLQSQGQVARAYN
ncbi:MAG: Mannose-6-phosphate isomerase [Candidatus Celerinatantimonas neptuna]|nr:MAG: Mannose-6-phosphate isomerase [Candidatus Celerinatantimonas neptuna]